MRSFLHLAAARRSVRRYAPRPVPRDVLDRCLEAARLAPSACNAQPWRFLVCDEPDRRDALFEAAFGGPWYGFNRFAAAAPVLVAVLTGTSGGWARLGGAVRGVRYALIDVGIACEHFCLQAAEEGLGTCWLGWLNGRRARRALGLGREVRIDVILAAGYPADDDAPRPKQRKPLDAVRAYVPPGRAGGPPCAYRSPGMCLRTSVSIAGSARTAAAAYSAAGRTAPL